ncbi:MAG: hypothetical protein ACLU4J_15700 [Butyricimonas paravirosa]
MRAYCEPYDKAKVSTMNGVPLVVTFDMEGKLGSFDNAGDD